MTEQARGGRDLGAFIPACLDDYGLNVYEFRIYACLARIANNPISDWDLEAIANHCRMTVEQARAAIIVLEKSGLISASFPQSGQVLQFCLKKPSSWRSPEDLPKLRKHASSVLNLN